MGDTGIFATNDVDVFPNGVSPHGAFDMSGNVWEWTCSLWGKAREKPITPIHIYLHRLQFAILFPTPKRKTPSGKNQAARRHTPVAPRLAPRTTPHQAPRSRAQPPCFEIANHDRCKYRIVRQYSRSGSLTSCPGQESAALAAMSHPGN
ncbi:MAG: formylglycine-generating enzyme family protein [Desulfobacterales bacterium]|nr:formylglycine-generating enzyme family protein [Desulfobacterales bacterium]